MRIVGPFEAVFAQRSERITSCIVFLVEQPLIILLEVYGAFKDVGALVIIAIAVGEHL